MATAGCSKRSRPGSPAGNGRTDMDIHAPPHDWWDWYAAYMDARQAGSTPDEASAAAGRYMAEVKNVVVS
jgi:hypothetical protein